MEYHYHILDPGQAVMGTYSWLDIAKGWRSKIVRDKNLSMDSADRHYVKDYPIVKCEGPPAHAKPPEPCEWCEVEKGE